MNWVAGRLAICISAFQGVRVSAFENGLEVFDDFCGDDVLFPISACQLFRVSVFQKVAAATFTAGGTETNLEQE